MVTIEEIVEGFTDCVERDEAGYAEEADEMQQQIVIPADGVD